MASSSSSDGTWTCIACTFVNNDALSVCEICESPYSQSTNSAKHKHKTMEHTVESLVQTDCPQSWVCSVCTLVNKNSTSSCEACTTAKTSLQSVEEDKNNVNPTPNSASASASVSEFSGSGDDTEVEEFDIVLKCGDPPTDITSLDVEFPMEAITIPQLKSFIEFPCSLVLEEDSASMVSKQAHDVMKQVSEVLGPLGRREGYYGAGGGALHFLYCGKFDQPFPDLNTIVTDVLRIKSSFHPPFAWMSTVDPCHQQIFPRTAKEVDNTDDFLRKIYTALNQPTIRSFSHPIPHTTQQEFPYITSARLLFVEPLYDMFHDGGCPSSCPRNDTIFVERVGEEPGSAGDIPNSPSFAIWQLITGEIMALCTWDYRD